MTSRTGGNRKANHTGRASRPGSMTVPCCVCGQPATAMLRDDEGRVWHYCAACMERKADAPPPISREAS
jgi:hypothetical protein